LALLRELTKYLTAAKHPPLSPQKIEGKGKGRMRHSLKVFNWRSALLISSSMTLIACSNGMTKANLLNDTERSELIFDTADLDALGRKSAEYQQVFREARVQGAISGGVRGAIVGAIISGEGSGVAVGAFLGGLVGSNYSVYAAEKLLQERQEFLNRQEIIDNILNAARDATNKTERDAEIVGSVVDSYSKYNSEAHIATREKISEAAAVVSRAAAVRALFIEESLKESKISEEDAQEIRALLKRQISAIKRMSNIEHAWNSESHD
jgi:hypothetical protein